MTVSLVLMWFFLVIGILLVLNSYWLASVALFPDRVGRARDTFDRPWKVLLVGLAIGIPLFAAGIYLLQAHHPVFKFLGTTVVSIPVFLGLFGSTGLAERMGAGLGAGGRNDPSWRRVLRGGGVMGFLGLLPFIGWFIVFPALLLMGVGAFVLTASDREETPMKFDDGQEGGNPYAGPEPPSNVQRRPRRRRSNPRSRPPQGDRPASS